MIATVNIFFYWCNQNQIVLFNTNISDDYILNSIDKNKINELGEKIGNYAELLEDSKENENLEGDNNFYLVQNGENFAISELFNPIGYSVWSYMQGKLSSIFSLFTLDSAWSLVNVYTLFILSYILTKNASIPNLLNVSFTLSP